MSYEAAKQNEEDEGKQRLKLILAVVAAVIAVGLVATMAIKTHQAGEPHVVGSLGADGKVHYFNPKDAPNQAVGTTTAAPAPEAPDPNLPPSKQ